MNELVFSLSHSTNKGGEFSLDIPAMVEKTKKDLDREYLNIAIDMDKTLTLETCWTPDECLIAKPNLRMIEAINLVSRRNWVTIYTARRNDMIDNTLRWLRINEVRFNAFSNNKEPFDLVIDDRAFNPFLDGNSILNDR